MVKHITVSPPRTPPIMARMFVEPCSEGTGIEFDGGHGEDVPDGISELEAGDSDACVMDGVIALAKEVLYADLEVDVVVASTVLGTARRRSVIGFAPQAMYSNG
jgi:ABC-type amino acid transport substrate-binding protein